MVRSGGPEKQLIFRLVAIGGVLVLGAWLRTRLRVDPARDPLKALGAAVMRYPMLRDEVAMEHFAAPCAEGSAAACTELGRRVEGASDLLEQLSVSSCIAPGLFAVACDGGDWGGCAELARAHRPTCGDFDRAHARDVLERACSGAAFAACDALAALRR